MLNFNFFFDVSVKDEIFAQFRYTNNGRRVFWETQIDYIGRYVHHHSMTGISLDRFFLG